MEIPGGDIDGRERDEIRSCAGAIETRIDLAPERRGRRQRLSNDKARDLLLRRLEYNAAISADYIREAEPTRAIRIDEFDHNDIDGRHARAAYRLCQPVANKAGGGADGHVSSTVRG